MPQTRPFLLHLRPLAFGAFWVPFGCLLGALGCPVTTPRAKLEPIRTKLKSIREAAGGGGRRSKLGSFCYTSAPKDNFGGDRVSMYVRMYTRIRATQSKAEI